MKVGIITFHFTHNYGAMIQAYAMQQFLCKLGHEVYIIDYAPKYHTSWFIRQITWKSCFHLSPRYTYYSIKNKILNGAAITQRYDNFEIFYKNKMNLYPYNSKDDMSFFDVVLLGSDQIWNIELTNNDFDGPYFGAGFKCKVFSYAASAMFRELSIEQTKVLKNKLSHLYKIGVREINLMKLLQPLIDKKIYVNLDPTLLGGTEIYNNLNLSNPISKKYVLTYELQPHKDTIDMAKYYAKANGFEVISLIGNVFHNTHKGYDLTASPERFLAYINNAECVFTTSFHGAALSIVFNKQFYSIRQNNSKDDRLISLFEQLQITNHLINSNQRPTSSKIDYKLLNYRMDKLKKKSIEFLTAALSFKES